MIDSRRDRDPVELLADEYASRCRAGETPSIAEYVDKYPLFADQIRLLFPAVEMMERFRVNEQAREHGKHQRFSSLAVPSSLGDFTIVREIGRGGMGVVYEAEQQSLARRVAVKVLPKQMLLSDEHLRRFQREAQTAARLHHTNIVPVFGIGEQDGLHYYVMPLIRGVGLDELIRHVRGTGEMETRHCCAGGRGGGEEGMRAAVRDLVAKKFPSTTGRDMSGERSMVGPAGDRPAGHGGAVAGDRWRMTANVGLQAAVALDYAHGQGTLHRDIKPSNLLVDERGLVLVADFGLARAVDLADASRGDDVVGTWRYMAPEQFEGNADPRSDIYALGLTLYELLVLQPAFRGADRARHVPGRRSDPELVRPRGIDPSVPRDLETVILKCVAAEPARRYERAAALADDLQRLLEGRPIRARRVSLPERAWRWCRRSPALAIVSALAALSLLAAAAMAIVGYVQTSRAYAQTRQALARTDATSRLSLQVLDDIYLQLSPDRIWVLSDVGAGGEACACLGLRTGAGAAILGQRHAMQVRLSEETASLLNGLLIFYDRLAEQSGDDSQVKLQSAIARRRIGDIRQRLGQLALAETEYAKAIRHLHDLSGLSATDAEVARELARTCNELGNIQTAQLEHARAHESHWNAMRALQSCQAAIATSADLRYEMARTHYLLGNKVGGEVDRLLHRASPQDSGASGTQKVDSRHHRAAAVRLLDALIRENPGIPEYRFLLALCHRPMAADGDGVEHSLQTRGRHRAVEILEELKTQYPEVADYRYELAVTRASVQVGLFPWQSPATSADDAEEGLQKALDEARWLVTHNPSIPGYLRSEALILAKLGALHARRERLADAQDGFQRAFDAQCRLVASFTDASAYDRVLMEFYRLRLAQVCYLRNTPGGQTLESLRDALNACIDNLQQLSRMSELADDRLTCSALPLACETLHHVLLRMGDEDAAEKARAQAREIRDAHVPRSG